MSVLRRSLDQSGTVYPETDYFCTRVMSRLAWPGQSTYALGHHVHALGTSFAHHDAEEDDKLLLSQHGFVKPTDALQHALPGTAR